MIVVKVELWPGGNESRSRSLGTAFIVNNGTGTAKLGNYDVALMKMRDATQVYRLGRLTGWVRRKSPWNLLMLAIATAEMQPVNDATLRRTMVAIARRAMNGQEDLFGLEQD